MLNYTNLKPAKHFRLST